MKTRTLLPAFFCVFAILLATSCSSRSQDARLESAPTYPATTFMVLSDTHFFDPSFGVSGPEWKNYMRNDRKLLAESKETLESIIDRVVERHPDFVLISGDLTKDGEADGHKLFAAELKKLTDAGIKPFVILGNHDVVNLEAKRFTDTGSESVPTITSAQFAEIYAPYGYRDSISRDPASLSYVAEPVPGLWLLAIDSVKYEQNEKLGHSETSGRVREGTMQWIAERLADAKAQGKAVIAMEHHPIMEHIYDMKSKYGEYVLDNGAELSEMLAKNDVRYIFTGHYHAQSIVRKTFGDKYIVDVETGSPVTWPCEFRTVRFTGDGNAEFGSDRIAQLASYEKAGKDFDKDGYEVIAAGLKNIANDTLKKFKVPDADCAKLTDGIVAAMMSHYKGDAKFTGTEVLSDKGLSIPGKLVVAVYRPFIEGLWKLRPPKGIELMSDNTLTIAWDGREMITEQVPEK